MSNGQEHIRVESLTMAYGDFVIQKDLEFTVDHGDIFIIMGGSGCGKSTLLKIMIGLKAPATGEVYYHGDPFWASGEGHREELKRSFGILFQSGALFSSMTLAENIGLPLQLYTDLSPAEIDAIETAIFERTGRQIDLRDPDVRTLPAREGDDVSLRIRELDDLAQARAELSL